MKGAARVSSPVMFGAVGLLLLVLPWLIGSGYYLHIAITSLVFVILATSLDLLVGYSGLLSLGHTAFFAVGEEGGVAEREQPGIADQKIDRKSTRLNSSQT